MKYFKVLSDYSIQYFKEVMSDSIAYFKEKTTKLVQVLLMVRVNHKKVKTLTIGMPTGTAEHSKGIKKFKSQKSVPDHV